MTTALEAPAPVVTVRPASPAEADAIHALTQAAYGEYRDQLAPSSALLETRREVWERMARGEFRAAVAEIDGRLAGSVRFKVSHTGLYFFRLAVDPGHRQRGVARALLAWLEEEAARSRVHRLWCQVRLIVPRNVALYEKNGFAIVERHVVVRNGVEVPTATMEKRIGGAVAPVDVPDPALIEAAAGTLEDED